MNAIGVRSIGSCVAAGLLGECAISITRRPVFAFCVTRVKSGLEEGRSTSGAPRNHDPCPSYDDAFHLRAESKGIWFVSCQSDDGNTVAID